MEKRLKSWSQLSDLSEKLDLAKGGKIAYVFRGHSDSNWELKPSILRRLETDIAPQKVLDLEQNALELFQSQAHLLLPQSLITSARDPLGWFSLMQHYSAPTRLLDWTKSIFIAAYFALEGAFNRDGAIWMVHVGSTHLEIEKKYPDSFNPLTKRRILDNYFNSDSLDVVHFVDVDVKPDRMITQQGIFSVCQNITW